MSDFYRIGRDPVSSSYKAPQGLQTVHRITQVDSHVTDSMQAKVYAGC